MQLGWLVRIRSIWYALVLHIIAAALLVLSFDFTTPIKPQALNVNIVNAVAVDKTRVEKELQNLKKEDEKKKQAEKDRLAELEKKAEDLKKQRQEEEKKLLEAKKKKEQEKKLREEEQQKLAELDKQKAQAELDKQLAEEEKQRDAEEQKKKEADLKKKQDEERIAKENAEADKVEKELQEQLAKEAAAGEAEAQKQQDGVILNKYITEIYNKVSFEFNDQGLPNGLSCTLNIKLFPSGEVASATVVKTSGNPVFDRRAETAVNRASPLPVPDDVGTFDRIGLRDFNFIFKL